MRILVAAIVACTLLLRGGVAMAQPAATATVGSGPPAAVQQRAAHFTATVSPSPVRSGEVALVKIVTTIKPGFHIYSVVTSSGPGPTPTTITLIGIHPAPDGRIADNDPNLDVTFASPPIEESPTVVFDQGFGKNVGYHTGTTTFTVPIRVTDAHQIDSTIVRAVQFIVRCQACNDKYCEPPANAAVGISLRLGPGPPRPAYTDAPIVPPAPWVTSAVTMPASGQQTPPSQHGMLGFIAAAFIAGLLALLTPCVFPLIPVTFGYFTKQLGASGGRLVALASCYSIGIVVSFTLLGLIVAATIGENGPNRIAANPWFNIAFGVLFVVFGFAFFEAFTPQLPGFLQRFTRPAKTGSSFATVLLMGLAFVFAAFTCTAPFVASVLSLAVTANHTGGGGWLQPVLGMVFFSLALALPFFLLSLFPSLLAKLPRSGSWLSITKALLGFVELAFAVLYFSKADLVWQAHVITRPVIFGVWAAIAICGALYLIGALRLSKYQEAFERLTPGRGIGALAFAACAVYCFYAQSGRPINASLGAYLPPPGYGNDGGSAASTGGAEVIWLSNYDQALAVAKSSGKPVFIDFTGYTCTNCRWMELNIFPKPAVAALLKQFVTVRLYTDGGADGPKNQALQTTLAGEVAQPLYAILAPDGHKIAQSVGLDAEPSHLVSFLGQGLAGRDSSSTASTAPNQNEEHAEAVPASSKAWGPYLATSLADARKAHRPMVVDFSAKWCVPCHEIENTVFPNPAVAALTPKFETYTADLTSYDSPQSQKLEDQFGIEALPTIVFIDASGKESPGTRVTGIIPPSEFASRMQRTLVSAGTSAQ